MEWQRLTTAQRPSLAQVWLRYRPRSISGGAVEKITSYGIDRSDDPTRHTPQLRGGLSFNRYSRGDCPGPSGNLCFYPEISRHSSQRGPLRREVGEWWVPASEGLGSAQGSCLWCLALTWSTIYGTDVHTCRLIVFFVFLPFRNAISLLNGSVFR